MRDDRALCVSDCRRPNHPAPDCPGDCRGCLPRLAVDGLKLCGWHLGTLADDARTLPELHAEIGLRLAGSSGAGEKTSGSKDPGIKLDERAVAIRTEIMHVLVSWTLLICEERGAQPPAQDRVGAFVARHAEWLAAHPAAADASSELRDLVRRAWPIAYPSGARVFQVAACPMHDCPGTIKAIVRRTDALLPSSLVCDTDGSHEWPADRWLTLGKELRRREAA